MLFRLTLLFTALLVAPAHAVVNGQALKPSKAPWFVPAGICGATLIAPDRLATAAHCVDPVDLGDFETIKVGGETRRGVAVALPSTWREQSAGFARDDVAIIKLDRPVTRVQPVPLATSVPAKVRILGQGKRAWDAPTGRIGLRQATLTTIADRACGPRWKGTKYAKRFEAASEVCAGGRASVCAGDSGGPMIGGTLAKPVLVGIISWTGARCGEDKLPSVSAEASHYADFLLAPEPVWAPTPAGPTTITRSGDTLSCTATWTVAPDTVQFRWRRRQMGKTHYEFVTVARTATYTPTKPGLYDCEALGSNAGGRATAPPSSIRA
ncbi:trypsin-like serine protease [Solirubrobacter taibaiensis]|nr:trypsin-like serine protease [Solirubrobacter taibaiensis]